MLKLLFTTLIVLVSGAVSQAQITQTKSIDEGGSGPYPAVAVTDGSLAGYTIYRPEKLKRAVAKEGKLPIVVWANGACANTSTEHERFLTEIASRGYLIVAVGNLQLEAEAGRREQSDGAALLGALDWITAQATRKGNDYYGRVDTGKIAAAGMSCGGAQVMRIAGDPRVARYMMFNSGMGDMSMAGASKASLKALTGEVLYVEGGETDIAYNNALMDYDRVGQVPIYFASHATAGHGGTYADKYGGSFAALATDWLDWQFKGKDHADVFLSEEAEGYPDFTFKAKNFDQ
ncbi:alpha/beta hydrolase [Lewinella sp. IMCC34183]|uniref:alpha/beta hydrolase n=1 Tax=Lewinella sp. IMCC34183 TaxID=2248762 RepID=UPI000E252AC6|nr:alpha/beta hydrolase [Lewinella sp. IMCC34183]